MLFEICFFAWYAVGLNLLTCLTEFNLVLKQALGWGLLGDATSLKLL